MPANEHETAFIAQESLKGEENMQRRDLCSLMAAAAAPTALPLHAQSSGDRLAAMPARFNNFMEDYAEFRAKSPEQGGVYVVINGRILEQKLDDTAWQPTTWGKPPKLPNSYRPAVEFAASLRISLP